VPPLKSKLEFLDTNVAITYKTITPLFKFRVEDEIYFTGVINSVNYSVSIKKHEAIQPLLDGVTEFSRNKLISIHMDEVYGFTDYYLICSFNYDDDHIDPEGLRATSTNETWIIKDSVLTALRLLSTSGILYFNNYTIRIPPLNYATIPCNHIIDSLQSRFYNFHSAFKQESIFESSNSDMLVYLSNYFSQDRGDNRCQRLLSLCLKNYYFSFTTEDPKISFLMLMIICDCLFKEESETASNASGRISKVLAKSRKDIGVYNKLFYSNADSFYKIRNLIAHGEPSLRIDLVNEKLVAIHPFIQQLIINFIKEISVSISDVDYFPSLDEFLRNKLDKL